MERLHSELDYIKKNIARASTNAGAVGRLKRMSRDLAAIEAIGIMTYRQSRKWSETGVGAIRMYTVAEAETALKAIKSPVSAPAEIQHPAEDDGARRRTGAAHARSAYRLCQRDRCSAPTIFC